MTYRKALAVLGPASTPPERKGEDMAAFRRATRSTSYAYLGTFVM